jgi:uncharacterized membrane protein
MLFVFLQLEVNRTCGYFLPPLRLPALTQLWLVACAFLLLQYSATASRPMFTLLVAFVAGLLFKLFLIDLPAWTITDQFWYSGQYRFGDAGFRLLDFGAVIGFFAWAFTILRGRFPAKQAGKIFGAAGLILLFVYTTLELNTFLHQFVEGFRAGGVSILWSLFALSMVLLGIRKTNAALRYVGLALFGLVTGKIFLFDLASLGQVHRIVAFFVLGLLVLAGSFLYLTYRPTFSTEANPPENAGL